MLKIICPKCKHEVEISGDKLGEVVTCDSSKKPFVAGSVPDNKSSHATFRAEVPAGNGALSGNGEKKSEKHSGNVYVPQSTPFFIVCYELFFTPALFFVFFFVNNFTSIFFPFYANTIIYVAIVFVVLQFLFVMLLISMKESVLDLLVQLLISSLIPVVALFLWFLVLGRSIFAMKSDAIHCKDRNECKKFILYIVLILLPFLISLIAFPVSVYFTCFGQDETDLTSVRDYEGAGPDIDILIDPIDPNGITGAIE